jgi:hypothetical protein
MRPCALLEAGTGLQIPQGDRFRAITSSSSRARVPGRHGLDLSVASEHPQPRVSGHCLKDGAVGIFANCAMVTNDPVLADAQWDCVDVC